MTNTKTVAECLPSKPRTKHRDPWETLAVRKKRDNVKAVSLSNKRNPTNVNTQKLKGAQRKLTNIYQKKRKEYIQSPINKIRNSVEDRQSRIPW